VQFFGLFGFTNRASSVVGPNVIQAIISKTGNTWHGFPFLFSICLTSGLIIWLAVDVPKGRRDAERWAAEQRGTVYDVRSALDGTRKDDAFEGMLSVL
jgi:MFS-type transporter involved in bile tolerance (Atg22 family)